MILKKNEYSLKNLNLSFILQNIFRRWIDNRWKIIGMIYNMLPHKFFCVEKNQRFLLNFSAMSPNQFLNEYSRNTENALCEWLEKETTKYFTKSEFSIEFEYSIQNCFWNVFSTSGLSQIWKIRNVWKLPSPFKEYSDHMLWKDFLETSFWKKYCSINSKTVIKNFLHVKFRCKPLNFMVLGYPRKKSQNHRNLCA
jgi:hypothetical protein